MANHAGAETTRSHETFRLQVTFGLDMSWKGHPALLDQQITLTGGAL